MVEEHKREMVRFTILVKYTTWMISFRFTIMTGLLKFLGFIVIGLTRLKESFQNPPFDWNGDPCLPKENAWTGVTCSNGSHVRVTGL